jgi:hypothetical protein
MWSIAASAAAAAAADADQVISGQLPPSIDVSVREDVKM